MLHNLVPVRPFFYFRISKPHDFIFLTNHPPNYNFLFIKWPSAQMTSALISSRLDNHTKDNTKTVREPTGGSPPPLDDSKRRNHHLREESSPFRLSVKVSVFSKWKYIYAALKCLRTPFLFPPSTFNISESALDKV